MSAWDRQEGGSHYKDMAIQPSEYIAENGFGWLEGNAIKYLSRFRKKGSPRGDLLKARHYIDKLLEDFPEYCSAGVADESGDLFICGYVLDSDGVCTNPDSHVDYTPPGPWTRKHLCGFPLKERGAWCRHIKEEEECPNEENHV